LRIRVKVIRARVKRERERDDLLGVETWVGTSLQKSGNDLNCYPNPDVNPNPNPNYFIQKGIIPTDLLGVKTWDGTSP
jgi:hypothetical protein